MTHRNIHCSSSTVKMDTALEYSSTIQIIPVNNKAETRYRPWTLWVVLYDTRKNYCKYLHCFKEVFPQYAIDMCTNMESERWLNKEEPCTAQIATFIYKVSLAMMKTPKILAKSGIGMREL